MDENIKESEEVRARLKEIQEFLDYDNLKMAESLGISEEYYQDMKYGSKPISSTMVIQLMEILNVNPVYLLTGMQKKHMILPAHEKSDKELSEEILDDFEALSRKDKLEIMEPVKEVLERLGLI